MVIFSILFCFVSEGRAAGRQFSDKSFHTFEKSRMSQLTRCRADLFLASCDRKQRCYRYYFTDGDMHTAQHSTATRDTLQNLHQRVSEERSHAGGAPLTKEPQCHRNNLKPQSCLSRRARLIQTSRAPRLSETRTDRQDGVSGGYQ